LSHARPCFWSYGTNSWVSRLPTRQTIEAITQDDLIKFHQHWYWPSNFVVAVSGDFQSNQILAMLEVMFSSWPFRGEQPPLPPTNFTFAPPAIYMVHKQVNQARVRIIMPNSIKMGRSRTFRSHHYEPHLWRGRTHLPSFQSRALR